MHGIHRRDRNGFGLVRGEQVFVFLDQIRPKRRRILTIQTEEFRTFEGRGRGELVDPYEDRRALSVRCRIDGGGGVEGNGENRRWRGRRWRRTATAQSKDGAQQGSADRL